MSEGATRSFWKKNRAAIQIAALAGAIGLAIAIPFIQSPLCTVAEQNSYATTYSVTVDREAQEQDSGNSVSPTITQFAFGPSVNGSIGTIQRTEATYNSPKEKEDWGRKFWCDINAGDYFLVLFTLALAISTFLLWRETERLAEGAGDQSEKMRQSIREQRRAVFASIVSAKAAKKSADAADRHASAAVGAEVPILQIVSFKAIGDETDDREVRAKWLKYFHALFEIKNFGRTTAVVTEVIVNVHIGIVPTDPPELIRYRLYPVAEAIEYGETKSLFDIWARNGVTDEMVETMLADASQSVYAFGEIKYRDFRGTHEQGWVFIWVAASKIWSPFDQKTAYWKQS